MHDGLHADITERVVGCAIVTLQVSFDPVLYGRQSYCVVVGASPIRT